MALRGQTVHATALQVGLLEQYSNLTTPRSLSEKSRLETVSSNHGAARAAANLAKFGRRV